MKAIKKCVWGVSDGNMFFISKCRRRLPIIDSHDFKFCPYCGGKIEPETK